MGTLGDAPQQTGRVELPKDGSPPSFPKILGPSPNPTPIILLEKGHLVTDGWAVGTEPEDNRKGFVRLLDYTQAL